MSENSWPQRLKDMLDVAEHALQQEPNAKVLAEKVVTSIAKYHGGRMFYLPRGDTLVRAMRDRKIFRDFTGHNHDELITKYNLSHNQVYVILKQQAKLNSKQIEFTLN